MAADNSRPLTGVVFEPFKELNLSRDLDLVPASSNASIVRQKFDDDCEAAINEQINVEYNVSYVYHAIYAYFDRENVALKGLAKFFKGVSEEEREHAEKLMEYQTLILGNRETIDDMSTTSASVLTTILKLIDNYDLYGRVAYPKHHKQSDVPDIYRLAAKTMGVFINPAFIEPFGLTLIEAAAHGFPIVATKNGGPVDIHRVLDNGRLPVDPHDQNAISDALYKLVSDKQLWKKCRQNGLNNIHLFSWPEHCRTYLSKIAICRPRHPQWQKSDDDVFEDSQAGSPNDSLRDIQDISLNLKLSLDGDKPGSGSIDNGLDSIDNINDRKSTIEKALSKFPKGIEVQKIGFK